jgi:hypothetical protein
MTRRAGWPVTFHPFADIVKGHDTATALLCGLPWADGVEARPITTRETCACWASFYDEPGNEFIDIEQPIVREILDGVP